MTAGDFGNYKGPISNGITKDIRPGSGVVEDLKTIAITGACKLYWKDTVNDVQFPIDTFPDGLNINGDEVHWQNEYDCHLQIENISGGSINYVVKYGVLQ